MFLAGIPKFLIITISTQVVVMAMAVKIRGWKRSHRMVID